MYSKGQQALDSPHLPSGYERRLRR